MSYLDFIAQHKRTAHSLAIALGLLLIGSLIYIVSSLSRDDSPPLISLPQRAAPSPTPTPIRARMSIEPQTIDATARDRFEVQVAIDANNTIINGTDSIITYDPAYLKVLRINAAAGNDTTFSLLRRQIEENRVIITSIKNQADDIPTKEATVAAILFQAMKKGTTSLSFEHNPGTTTGSTVIQAEGSENILDEVRSTTITIK